ncbi:hypothetical protein AB5I41_31800 [Sphingomonas sp. MMS24-JH45]
MPPSWPVGDAYLKQNEAALPSVSYRDVFRDARLQTLIDRALANNRDLRAAVANIAVARGAQFRIQRLRTVPRRQRRRDRNPARGGPGRQAARSRSAGAAIRRISA